MPAVRNIRELRNHLVADVWVGVDNRNLEVVQHVRIEHGHPRIVGLVAALKAEVEAIALDRVQQALKNRSK